MFLSSYKKAKAIIKKYGTGYYRATFLFPKEVREATWIYYRFVRTADEFVDSATVADHEGSLTQWERAWHGEEKNEIYQTLFDDYKQVITTYGIPLSYTESFFRSMEQDLVVSRYATYADLEAYMYGSAVVVGYTMSHIIGCTDGALPYAKALGEAFQMTNFLRDIAEDYDERGRIYLPQEDMERFGVTEDHIKHKIVDTAWKNLMRFEVERARVLYKKGVEGIMFLNPRGRRAVYASALIYKEILDAIEASDYDIFARRLVVSPFKKTMLLLQSLCKTNL